MLFLVEVIEQSDLSALTRQYGGRGSAAHHPAVLLGLLIYGYAGGVHSSRKIERATYDSMAFRFVAANTHPDHDTLAMFRRRFLKEVEKLFVQVLVLAREMKLLKLGHIALPRDGGAPWRQPPSSFIGSTLERMTQVHQCLSMSRTTLICLRSRISRNCSL